MITINPLDNSLGCDICYQSAYSDKKILKYITKSNVTNCKLYRCPKCGSYWEANETAINIIDEIKMKESYSLKYKLNPYIKLILALLYIVIFYYAWAKFKVVGVLVTLASYYITILGMDKN